jgi:hypothetical protein
MKQRVYIDTSVIGGCFDSEFKEWPNKLFDDFISGKKVAVVSDITLDELSDAPKRVQENFRKIPETNIEVLISNMESRKLAEQYILEGAVSGKYYEDALHIAISTINQVNVLASWNFKHIVNLDRIRQYNAVNLKSGYAILEIRSPREILKFNDDED